eukprot:SAG31_NODE_11419_length_1032_cov_1.821008_1_plen_72_part_10
MPHDHLPLERVERVERVGAAALAAGLPFVAAFAAAFGGAFIAGFAGAFAVLANLAGGAFSPLTETGAAVTTG